MSVYVHKNAPSMSTKMLPGLGTATNGAGAACLAQCEGRALSGCCKGQYYKQVQLSVIVSVIQISF